MKKNIAQLLLLLCIVIFFACKKYDPTPYRNDGSIKGNISLYMPQAAQNGGYATVLVPKPFPGQGDSTIVTAFNGCLGGYDNAAGDITLEFAKDNAKLDSLNQIETFNSRPPYETLPDSVVQISGLDAVIKSGQRISDVLKFSIPNSKIQPGHKYILPITLQSASGGHAIQASLQTTYFVINVQEAKIEGNYTSTGYLYHPSSPRALSLTKTITKVAENQYQVDLGDLGSSGYRAIFSFEPGTSNFTITAAPGATGAPYTMFTDGLPAENPGYTPQWSGSGQCNNRFDPGTRTFYIRYGYMGATGWRVTEEFLKQK